jgi:adenylate cyclase
MASIEGTLGQSFHVWVRGAIVGLTVALAASVGLLEGIERWALNAVFHLRGPLPLQTPIVIVSIGEDSFDELYLAWPWPRALHGQFLDLVSRARPAAVGFDLIFSEPSSRGPEDDQAFAEALSRAGNVILAAAMTVIQTQTYVKEDMNAPISLLRKKALGFGFANFVTDDDAFVRAAELTRTYQEREFPSFDLQVYQAAVKAGVPAHPFDESRFLVNYRGGPKTFPTIPYYQVLTGEVTPEVMAGKIVLVGATSSILQDVHPTPFSTQGSMPGIEIHANVLETLFQGIPLQPVPRGTRVPLALLAGLLAVWLTNRFRPVSALSMILAVALVYEVSAYVAFTKGRLVLEMSAVPLALVIGYGASVVENFIQEQRKRAALMQLFEKSVSPEVAEAIWQHRDQFMSGGRLRSQKLVATVLFTDLKGFTSISERMDTQSLMDWINAYMEVMAQLVMKHGGVVDDYFGDAIKANFGVPFARTLEAEMRQDAVSAVECALAMESEMKRLNELWQAQGLPTVGMRVGIFTGEVVAGCLGSAQRLKFTTIGDAVNTASRLESFEKDLEELAQSPCRILISESTREYLGEQFLTQKFGDLSLKGKEKKIPVYRVLGRVSGEKAVERAISERKTSRVAVTGKVFISDGPSETEGSFGDLSQGGLSVCRLPKELAMGKVAELRFALPGAPHSIHVTGKVVWTAPDRAGVAFVNVKPSDQVTIKEFVSRGIPAEKATAVESG